MKAGNLTIKWYYDNAVTDCSIENPDLPFPIGVGKCVCAKSDMFCRNTGRKMSLARALKNANLPKEERKVIWELYRNTKPGGRW
jgi:hypothetical protein